MSAAQIGFSGLGTIAKLFGRIIFALGALLCAFVALVSYRYLLRIGPISDVIDANVLKNPWLIIHVAGAATSLLLGPLQFIPGIRNRFPVVHRLTGRIYVASCLVGGVAGFVLALGAATGPISTAGFGLLAILWVTSTGLAWRRAVEGNFTAHRAWMIRSFALTFAAVTLRLYLPVAMSMQFKFIDAYRAISFLCWVPNLLLAELYLRSRMRQF